MKGVKVLALAVAAALVLVPLGALAQGWFGTTARGKASQIHPLAADAGDPDQGQQNCQQGEQCGCTHPVMAGRLLRLLDMDDDQIDQLAERLDLSEEETERLKTLISEARPLRDELRDKLQEIREIIGPKVRDKLEENREQCRELADDLKEIRTELRDLFHQLKDAVRDDDQEKADQIKEQIREKLQDMRELLQQMRQNHCFRGRAHGWINGWKGKLGHRWGPSGEDEGEGDSKDSG